MAAVLSSIEATTSTSHVKKYLMYFGSGKLSNDVIADAVKKVKPQNTGSDSALIHLQIYLFINDPDVQELVGRFRKQLMPLTPMNLSGGGITKEFYVRLLFKLRLQNEFLQMIMASPNQHLSKQLTTLVAELMTRELNTTNDRIDAETAKLYLTALAQVACQNEEYLTHFKNLMTAFMNNSTLVGKFDKVQTLLRIIGLSRLTKEELEDSSEIRELMTKAEFDPTKKLREGKTFGMFTAFYPFTTAANGSDEVKVNGASANGPGHQTAAKDAFTASLNEFCTKEVMEVTSIEKFFHDPKDPDDPLNLLGSLAHITQLIVETNQGFQSQPQSQSPFEQFTSVWLEYKPKTTFEDYENAIKSFDDICELISIHAAANPRHQKRWFEEFLKYDESCQTPAGFRILENFVAENCDLELSLKLIAKLREAMSVSSGSADGGENQRIKSIILTIAKHAFEAGWKDELADGSFGGHAHNEFMTFGFSSDLHGLLNKAGALEFDPKAKFLGGAQISTLAKERNEYCSTVFRLFFENPMECALKMVPLAIRTQKFQVLHFARPFLALKTKPCEERTGTPNLLEHTLLTILFNTPENDSLLEAYEKNVALLVKEKLLTFEQVYEIVFYGLEKTLLQEDYGKWLKILRVWTQLFGYVIEKKATVDSVDEELVDRFIEDVLRLVLWTRVGFSVRNHQPVLEAREKFLELLELAKKYGLYKEKSKSDIPEFFSASMSLRELGLLWMTCPASWTLVTKHLLSNRPLLDALTQDRLISYMIPWVTNACRLEWNSVLDFAENLIKLKADGDGAISLHSVVNYTLVMSEMQPEIRVSHYLAFYSHFLRRQQGLKGYRVMCKEHVNTIATLVLFIQRIHDPSKDSSTSNTNAEGEGESGSKKRTYRNRDEYRSGLVQQSLLLLHEYVEWLILKSTHEHFGEIQEAALRLLPGTLPSIRGEGCFSSMSIFEAIVVKLKRGKESADETVFERNVGTLEVAAGGSRVQVTVPAKSGLKAEILENYEAYYENEELKSKTEESSDNGEGDGPSEPPEDDTKDMYPFHNTATEISAKLAVELKFGSEDK